MKSFIWTFEWNVLIEYGFHEHKRANCAKTFSHSFRWLFLFVNDRLINVFAFFNFTRNIIIPRQKDTDADHFDVGGKIRAIKSLASRYFSFVDVRVPRTSGN